MALIAGIDSSTQSCKVVVVDADSGAPIRTGRAPHPSGTSVPPAAWWDALQSAVSMAGGLGDVEAISVAGQQHGMVVLDANGQVIREALLWNDTRSADAADQLIAEVGRDEYASRTGVVPVASFTATKLRWLRDAEPENAARVAAVALPHDWLTWRLRGFGPADECRHGPDFGELVTDRSDASGTAYWSPATGDYDRELLVRAFGRDVALPRVLGPGEAAGRDRHLLIGPGAGDNAGAALGLGATEGDCVVSIGTSGTVFAVTTEPICDASGTVAGFADASGAFLPLVATLNAARTLDAIADLLAVDHSELAQLALASQPGANGAVLVPYFEGERTPNLPTASASFTGLTLASTTRPHLARAAVEGLLCGLADGLDAIVRLGARPGRVLLIGGAALNPAVQKVAAQVFGIPIVVPTPGEYVAMGAAVQAGWVASGERPAWSLSLAAELPTDMQPEIREQYAKARAAYL